MTDRLGSSGEVVIPEDLRLRLGLEPGDELGISLHDDHIAVRAGGRGDPGAGSARFASR
jgi:AbrB family looped-hinge helix DNA binding protein